MIQGNVYENYGQLINLNFFLNSTIKFQNKLFLEIPKDKRTFIWNDGKLGINYYIFCP